MPSFAKPAKACCTDSTPVSNRIVSPPSISRSAGSDVATSRPRMPKSTITVIQASGWNWLKRCVLLLLAGCDAAASLTVFECASDEPYMANGKVHISIFVGGREVRTTRRQFIEGVVCAGALPAVLARTARADDDTALTR